MDDEIVVKLTTSIVLSFQEYDMNYRMQTYKAII